jgi:hypothetical protein
MGAVATNIRKPTWLNGNVGPKNSMYYKTVLFATLILLPSMLRSQSPSDEEVVALNPFEVTSESDRGYQASSTLAGTRLTTQIKDVGSAISVVSAQFLQDTGPAIPDLPVTVIKNADALVIQFAIATTGDKAEERNSQINTYIESVAKAVQAVPGLRFEPREVYLASADRKRSIIGKGGVITSFAHFVVFADFSNGIRPYQRAKQVRDVLAGLKIDSATTKLIDGPTGLYIRRPSQYRAELLTKIFEDLETIKKGLGSDFEVLVSGLQSGVKIRACSETEIELWIDYSFQVRSIREIEAKKK